MACFVAPSTVALRFLKGSLAVYDVQSRRIIHAFEPPSLKIPIRWTSDGRALLIAEHRDDVSNLWLHPIDGSKARQITQFTSDVIWFFDLSPDGRSILSSRGDNRSDAVLVTGIR